MNIVKATRRFEEWLRRRTAVVEPDLRAKHKHMAEAALLVTGRDGSSSRSGPWSRQWLWSKAAGIAGGTSQVQRDIIAGRILGLPRS